MNNKFLIVLILLVGFKAVAKDDNGDLVVALAQSAAQIYVEVDTHNKSQPTQKNYLKRLNWLYKNNPCFYKLHSFKEDMPYYLAVLPLKIKDLENKILIKKNGLTSNALLKGLITTGISGLSAYGTYWMNEQRKHCQHSIWRSPDIAYLHIGMYILTGVFTAISIKNFDKAINYQKRLGERLERYKKILALLEAEHALNGEGSLDVAAIKLMKVVVQAINVAVDQAINTAQKENDSTKDKNVTLKPAA